MLGKGAQADREGRQLDHYYDVAAFNSAMAAGVVEKNAPDKSKVEGRGVLPPFCLC